MTIVFVDHRPFSHFLQNGFRQRVGRILHHFIREQRIKRVIYVWWNQELFPSGPDVQLLPDGFEKVTLCEARRARIPFARSLRLTAWADRHRVSIAAATISTFNAGACWVWATDPRICESVRSLADRIGGRLAYDLIDNFAIRDDFREEQRQSYAGGYRRVAASADRIVTNNTRSIDSLALPLEKTRAILNGVDWNKFHDAIGGPVPSDIASFCRPRVGFVGILSQLTDSNLLNAVANKLPECEVVCIGSVESSSSPLHPRIHCLGMKPYDQMAAYMAAFDVGVSIYKARETIACGDSQKAYEYLAAGRPVVATDAQTQGFASPFVMMTGSATEFVSAVRTVLQEMDTDELREARSQSVKAHDWRNRIKEILDFLDQPLASKCREQKAEVRSQMLVS